MKSHSPKEKRAHRISRHNRGRAKISGTADRPRIAVFKSNQHTWAQAIDDRTHTTLASVHDTSKGKKVAKGNKTERALVLGRTLAEALKTKKVMTAVFDKGGFTYHGRIKAVAEGLREAGIKI